MNENQVYECEMDPNPEITDKVIVILAITGAVAIAGTVVYGIGRLAYKINETIINKIWDKSLGINKKCKEEA